MLIKPLNTMRQCFYILIIRPLLLILLGFNVRHLYRLKPQDPHLIAANHNSHLDALALMSLFRFQDIPKVRLVAAKDYWCRTPLLTWFSLNIIGVIPIDRNKECDDDPTDLSPHYKPHLQNLKEKSRQKNGSNPFTLASRMTCVIRPEPNILSGTGTSRARIKAAAHPLVFPQCPKC
mgnify:CR=1 FL=1